MKTFQELSEQSNRARVDLLFADAEMALTMLDIARASEIVELKQKRINQALKAYSFIRKHVPTVSLTPGETLTLNKKLAMLRVRLFLS